MIARGRGETGGAERTAATEPEGGAEQAAAAGEGALALPERYQDLRQLGSGGFGEVRRVLDRALGRVVAMKLLRPELEQRERARARFLAEIRLAAGLSHPGIVALHDAGELPDGRLWFTMPEVRGRTLRSVIDEAFAAGPRGGASQRRRLLDHFARVCDAMAYAHSQGVIHRDLKPENVMVGAFGQVFVMDWGIARRVGEAERIPGVEVARAASAGQGLTRHGDTLGTPAYMAPEQLRGEVDRHGPSTDVYALGAMLHHVLVGRPPPSPRRGEIRAAPLSSLADPAHGVPPELVAVCARAMALEPRDRYADGAALAVEVHAFLEGAQRRERALAELRKSAAVVSEVDSLRARAEALRREASALLSSVRPLDPVDAKVPGWAREDEAEGLQREAALLETQWIQSVHGALALDPELPEAHAVLADHYKRRLLEAERAQRAAEAAGFEILLRAHDRGRHAAILSRRGALSLVTEPDGARVMLYRHVSRRRRLSAEPAGELGRTPLVNVPLEQGSYLLRISAPGRAEVRYPVQIERGEHWDARPPESQGPCALFLPLAGEIGDDEVYVPAGFAWTGGDPHAPDSLQQRRLWIDGFVIGRYPVTNEEYLAFLNDLLAEGREDEALRACPRANRGTVANADEELAYARGADGRFSLKEGDPGERWRPRGPAVLMDWHGAMAYARWRAARAGKPYRLMHELEREKATRGVDGREFPWGDHFDPTWACMLDSHPGEPGRVEVTEFPLDEGPYGMRGGAGNTRDFCSNRWTMEGPPLDKGRLSPDVAPPGDEGYRAIRGGAWSSVVDHCRAAARFVLRPDQRRSAVGLRVGWTLSP
ncbi:protein kinase domain-containing protein [Sorangium sp. So ce1000]|uniref:protein kinase domain-containing protein n=1 Tax=Sorangium sp. So ce1000 TaxID=3133325 RepID=UPI003F614F2A